MQLETKAEFERRMHELQKALRLMPDKALICPKCLAIYEDDRTRPVCYCDYESDRYSC